MVQSLELQSVIPLTLYAAKLTQAVQKLAQKSAKK